MLVYHSFFKINDIFQKMNLENDRNDENDRKNVFAFDPAYVNLCFGNLKKKEVDVFDLIERGKKVTRSKTNGRIKSDDKIIKRAKGRRPGFCITQHERQKAVNNLNDILLKNQDFVECKDVLIEGQRSVSPANMEMQGCIRGLSAHKRVHIIPAKHKKAKFQQLFGYPYVKVKTQKDKKRWLETDKAKQILSRWKIRIQGVEQDTTSLLKCKKLDDIIDVLLLFEIKNDSVC